MRPNHRRATIAGRGAVITRALPILMIGKSATWRARVERLCASQVGVHRLGAFAPGEVRPRSEVSAGLVLCDADDPRARRRYRRCAPPAARHLDFYHRVNPHCVLRSLVSRAHGCLSKGAASESIVSAIDMAQAGMFATEPLLFAEAPWDDASDCTDVEAAVGTVANLSPRQLDVIRLAAMGLSNKQIACEMGISPETVKSHLQRAFRDWEVHGRVALIAAVAADVARQQPGR